MKTKALYGFSSDLEPFAGRPAAAQVDTLRTWGCNAIFGGYGDPEFVQAAHRAGLRVYAEFGCFAGQRWWSEVPESRPLTAEGDPLEAEDGYYGVNPAVPTVRERQLQVLEALLAAHAIDGLWLDFIRWPCHWEVRSPALHLTSFDAGTLARFAEETGIDLPLEEGRAATEQVLAHHAAAWRAWRCAQITSWVAQARAVVDRTRPGTLLGLFGVPWRLSDYEGAIVEVIGQDYRALGRYVDVFSPMVYHRMCGRPPAWVGAVTHEVRALSAKPVWPIVQAVDEPDHLPAAEYGRVLDTALYHPASDGVIVFHVPGMLNDSRLQVTRMRFRERI
jgi:hypothetical protein